MGDGLEAKRARRNLPHHVPHMIWPVVYGEEKMPPVEEALKDAVSSEI